MIYLLFMFLCLETPPLPGPPIAHETTLALSLKVPTATTSIYISRLTLWDIYYVFMLSDPPLVLFHL